MKDNNRGEKAYNQLSDFLNGCMIDDMKDFVEASRRDHRTLQAKAFKLFMMYVEDTANRSYDARNEVAVLKARNITDKVDNLTQIPYI